jgi:hypothetical protein
MFAMEECPHDAQTGRVGEQFECFYCPGDLFVSRIRYLRIHADSILQRPIRQPISHGPILCAAVGSVIYLVLIAMLSLRIAVRGLLYLPPIIAQGVNDPLRRHLLQVAPMTAGLATQATTNLRSLPISPWAGHGVLEA